MTAGLVRALDAAHYTDPARFEGERERVFRRTWQYAGHASRLESPGDYFAFDLHGRSLFCVKGRGGEVQAFYNVCMHRAHQLVEQGLSTTVAEDIRLVDSVQRGLESGGYRPGPLVINPAGGVDSEHSVHALHGWLHDAMGG